MTIIFDPIDILCKSIFENSLSFSHTFPFVCKFSASSLWIDHTIICMTMCALTTKMGENDMLLSMYRIKIDCNGMKICTLKSAMKFSLCSMYVRTFNLG